jgi:MFS family permease
MAEVTIGSDVGPQPVGLDVASDEGTRPTALLPLTQLVRISAFWLGLTAIDGAVSLFLGFRLAYSDVKGDVGLGAATAFVTIGGALVAIVTQPTVGSISDYTISRWGRRKPYIVVGCLFDLVFLLALATANTLIAIAALMMLFNFSTNFARGPFQGYVPDLVAEPQVGMASAMVGLMQILGNITGFALATFAAFVGNLPLALVSVALVELVTMLSVVLHVGKGLPPKDRRGRSWTSIARETWGTDVLRERSYVWLVASRLFFLMAGGILLAYPIAYLKYVFLLGQSDAAVVDGVLLVVVAIASLIAIVPASRLSDRIGRKPVIYGACLVGACGVGMTALAPHIAIAIAGAAFFGTASGIFLAVDWALMTDIIPRTSAGRYMGLSNVASGSAPLLAAAVGGLVLDAASSAAGSSVGPRAAFLVAVGLYGVAALLLRPVVEPPRTKAPAPLASGAIAA